MNRTDIQLLELVRSAIWNIVPNEEVFVVCDWELIFRKAKIQTVIGLVADALSHLQQERLPERNLRLKFVSHLYKIQKTNIRHRSVMKKVYQLLRENRVSVVFMKGLVAGVRYPNPNSRQCGDIDFVVGKEDFQKTLTLLEQIGKVDYELEHEHHGMAFVDGVTIEPHYKVHNYQYGKNDKAMEDMFLSIFPKKMKSVEIDGEQIPTFPETFESVFLVSHMVNHVYEEGLGLRQIIDYALFLYSAYDKIDEGLHLQYLQKMHMEKAHRIFVRICEVYLGLPTNLCNYTYTYMEKKFADLLMKDVLLVGNFGRGVYVFRRDGRWGDFLNYCWVTQRSIRWGYLCPTEAYMWPISKMKRYFKKKRHLRKVSTFSHRHNNKETNLK